MKYRPEKMSVILIETSFILWDLSNKTEEERGLETIEPLGQHVSRYGSYPITRFNLLKLLFLGKKSH
jgi:hypothetical protein